MARTNPLTTSQLFRLLFIIFFVPVAFLRLLSSAIFFAFPCARPPRWPYRRCITIEIIKLTVEFIYRTEHEVHLSLDPGQEGDRFVAIQPRLDGIYTDVLDSAETKPATVGAVWYPKRYNNPDTSKKVVLHFHGGAYIICSAREEDCGFAMRALSRQLDDSPVLCLDYRLATMQNGRFPAAIQDAVTAYRYLIEDLHIEPSRIILSGDSAGGNLVLALLRYLADHPGLFPLPNAALLWSAWIDLADMAYVDRSVNRGIDCLRAKPLEWAVDKLTDNRRIVPSSHPYLSFAQSPFYVAVPIWVMVGTAESFYESNVQFVRDMRAVGNVLALYELADAPHDAFLARQSYELVREVKEATREVWDIIRNDRW